METWVSIQTCFQIELIVTKKKTGWIGSCPTKFIKNEKFSYWYKLEILINIKVLVRFLELMVESP